MENPKIQTPKVVRWPCPNFWTLTETLHTQHSYAIVLSLHNAEAVCD